MKQRSGSRGTYPHGHGHGPCYCLTGEEYRCCSENDATREEHDGLCVGIVEKTGILSERPIELSVGSTVQTEVAQRPRGGGTKNLLTPEA